MFRNMHMQFKLLVQIKPLMAPTKQIMEIGVKNYEWHELFPKGNYYSFLYYMLRELNLNTIDVSISNNTLVAVKNNAGAIVAVWAPIIVVSFDYNIYNSSFDGHSLEV
jgi:callose synthase